MKVGRSLLLFLPSGDFRSLALTPSAWRQAIRMTVAALLAYFGTRWVGLEEGYWAVITCLVVMQSTLGGTLDAGLSRVIGTVAGALLGGVGAWIQVRLGVALAGMLCALVLPLSLLAAVSAKFHMAPVTAALVLLAMPGSGVSFDLALHRTADIVLGAGVGTITTLFVFPNHGESNVRLHAAVALTTLGQLARSYLLGEGDADALVSAVQMHIARMQTACGEAMRERAFHLAGGPSPTLLLETIRRLRTDVTMIGQAAAGNVGKDAYKSMGDPIAAWFSAAAHALSSGGVPPDLIVIRRIGERVPPASTMSFVCKVLERDLADLCERIADRGSGEHSSYSEVPALSAQKHPRA